MHPRIVLSNFSVPPLPLVPEALVLVWLQGDGDPMVQDDTTRCVSSEPTIDFVAFPG